MPGSKLSLALQLTGRFIFPSMSVLVEVLDSDFCPKCTRVREKVLRVAKEVGAEVRILDPVGDIDRIVELGILTAPAVVINGRVKFAGNVPSEEEIREAIEEENS